MNDFLVIGFLVLVYLSSCAWRNVIHPKIFAKQYTPPFRKLANGQRFSKAYLDDGEFLQSGFEATFVLVFSKEHISVDVRGFSLLTDDGVVIPKITDTWCETYQRDLTNDEIDMIFSYVVVHDKDFMDSLKSCTPRQTIA